MKSHKVYSFDLLHRKEKEIHPPALRIGRHNISKYFAGIFGPEYLALLYIISGAKPAARITNIEKNYGTINRLCAALGVQALRTDFCLERKTGGGSDSKNSLFAYKRSFRKNRKNSIIDIYLSRDAKMCGQLKKAGDKPDNYKLGKLLGYPACCVKKYIKALGPLKYGNIYEALIFAQKKPSLLTRSYLNNVALGVFGIKMLCHFPCSPECGKSRKLAKKYLEVLKKYSKKYAKWIVKEQKAVVIYANNGELIYSNKYRRLKKGIRLDEIKGLRHSLLYKAAKVNNAPIYIKNPRTIEMNEKKFCWPETKIVVYN